jgi:5-methylcytosine-specific restriction endonuclease McrA
MKRTTPLRRTPFKRGGRKRLIANRIRAQVVRQLRADQDHCSRCGRTDFWLDAHELLSRAQGGSITDPANIILLCRPCHSWVTENPREAAEQGWAVSRKWPQDGGSDA